ncbi:MAG: DNA polymerase III subunit gamma/tau [Anaerococcus sp.]|nr:DNA polymerase III subunit gamma/tau [Peptoniphilaceae bacterium]MDY3055937.1 DNA polymerase III subunit gamma/tau [Anaerococcus sp.]
MAKALYRQYRPQTFDQVLGQDRVVNVLKNQVEKGMISHAYLFAGERGCGKTTCAKIFAKAINCKHPKNGSPCLECENCLSIDSETTMDVVEMDAASNRRIDDIRQIKETVMYPPNNLKYKVYIIDEAHMITKEAFNALLKMMEEPPSHLVFILATTEIDKIPPTILSRVQKFEFNKIDKEQILKQINIILDDYSIEMEEAAKDLIIRNAKGAMRDALSILDQVISSSKDSYKLSDVESILGVVGFKDLYNLAESINSYDKKMALEEIFKLRDNNKSNKDILDGLTSFYHDVLLYRSTMDERYFDLEEKITYVKKFSDKIDNTRLMDSLEILREYSEKMRYSESTDLILELAVLRLIDYKDMKNLDSRIRALETAREDSLVDLVNTIVERRFQSLDLSSLKISDNTGEENPDQDRLLPKEDTSQINKEDPEPKEEVKEIIQEDKIHDEKSEPKVVEKTEKSFQTSKSSQVFDRKTEEKIKNQIVKEAGPLVGTMFNIEGFNYDFDGDVFYLYYKDSVYHMFLEGKKNEIEKIVRNFTSESVEVKIIAEAEKHLIEESPSEKEKPESKNQALEKLEEIFGDDLIIE